VQALLVAGYRVYPVNSLQAVLLRERRGVSRVKSDTGHAHMLADMDREDRSTIEDVPASLWGGALCGCSGWRVTGVLPG
jgi:hypothetical protein